MDADEKRVADYVATLPPFEPIDEQEWENFLTQRLALPPLLFEEGDHEVAFAERFGRHLQVAFAKRLADGKDITPEELRTAADAVDFQGREMIAHNYAIAILMLHWKYYLLVSP